MPVNEKKLHAGTGLQAGSSRNSELFESARWSENFPKDHGLAKTAGGGEESAGVLVFDLGLGGFGLGEALGEFGVAGGDAFPRGGSWTRCGGFDNGIGECRRFDEGWLDDWSWGGFFFERQPHGFEESSEFRLGISRRSLPLGDGLLGENLLLAPPIVGFQRRRRLRGPLAFVLGGFLQEPIDQADHTDDDQND
jgi:hypothetical protein